MLFSNLFRLVVLCVVFVLLGACSSSHKEAEISVEKKVEKGIVAYKEGQYHRAVELLEPLATSGADKALYYFASSAKITNEPNISKEFIFKCFLNAAKNGVPEAMSEVANAYDNGYGVQVDTLKAVDWERKINTHQLSRARENASFLNNKGRRISDPERIEGIQNQAKSGEPDAIASLADMYDAGIWVEQNFTQAYELRLKLARKGDYLSMRRIAHYLCRGIGTERNVKGSNDWLTKAGLMTRCKP